MSEVIMYEYEKGASPKSRFYYDCPLKAALMAKYHGMLIMSPFWDGVSHNTKPVPWGLIVNAAMLSEPPKLYIHYDSLHLLDPKEADKDEDGFVFCTKTQKWWREYFLAENGQSIKGLKEQSTTARRDGKPFFWPEREAA
jgi:hypothetical protein